MSVRPSRRAFLSGQRSSVDPWLSFLAKLRARAPGTLTLDPQLFETRAHWVPTCLNDIEVARSLCQQFGVMLCLQGLQAPLDPSRLLLVVEPGRAWARPIPLNMAQGLWRFDAACTMQVLQAAGVVAALGAAPQQSLAHWFAMGTHGRIPFGGLAALGIENIEMMFVDGTIEALGAFGAQNNEPLRSIFTQRNIPLLFEVARQSNMSALMQNFDVASGLTQAFPYDCFRIDALIDYAGGEPHLGQFFVGHGGRLGWLVAITFHSVDPAATIARSVDVQKDSTKRDDKASDCANLNTLLKIDKNEVQGVNQSIKNILDSPHVFLP